MDRRRVIALFLVLPFLLPSVAPVLGTSPDHHGDDPLSRSGSINPWVVEGVGVERQAIYDMAVGEVDTSSPGLEVVVTGGGGIISQYSADDFTQTSLSSTHQTQQAIAIGDVSSIHDGNEIVTAGTDQKVHMFFRDGAGGWSSETVWNGPGSINGVTVGDFNLSRPGREIAVAGDEAHFAVLSEDPGVEGGWSIFTTQVQETPVTNMMLDSYDILPEVPGDEILIAAFSGHAFLATRTGDGDWNMTPIWNDTMAVLGFGYGPDLVPETTGPEIYLSTFSGRVVLVQGNENRTNWTGQIIYEGDNPIYSVVPGDVDPRYGGAELVAAGIGQDIHLIRNDNGSWVEESVQDMDGDRLRLLYDVEIGEVDSGHTGLEIITGGLNQDLLEVAYFEPGFEMVPVPDSQMAVAGGAARFWVQVESIGNFDDEIFLSVDGNASLSSSRARPGDLIEATVPVPPDHITGLLEVNLSGHSGELVAWTTLTVSVLPPTSPGLSLSLNPGNQTVIPGFDTTFVVKAEPVNDWSPVIEYELTGEGDFDPALDYDPGDPTVPLIIDVAVPVDAKTSRNLLEIRCTAGEGPDTPIYTTTVVATLFIDAAGSPDFAFTATPDEAEAVQGSVLVFDLSVDPLYGFSDDVVISVDGIPQGSSGTFTARVVRPPVALGYHLALGPVDTTEGTGTEAVPVLVFTASSGEKVHRSVVIVNHMASAPERDFGVQVLPSGQISSPGGTASYLVHVEGNGSVEEMWVETGGAPVEAGIRNGKGGNPDFRRLEVDVLADAVPGTYSLELVASSSWQRSAIFQVTVDRSKDLSMFLETDVVRIISNATSPGGLTAPDWKVPVSGLDAWDEGRDGEIHYTVRGMTPSAEGEVVFGDDGPYVRLDQLYGGLPAGEYLHAYIFDIPGRDRPKTLLLTVEVTEERPLLSLEDLEIKGENREGTTMTFVASLRNWGGVQATDPKVEFFVDGRLVGEVEIGPLRSMDEEKASLEWRAEAGEHNVTALVTSEGSHIQPRSLEKDVKIYEMKLVGPATALILLLVFAGTAIALRSTLVLEGQKRPRSRGRAPEEE